MPFRSFIFWSACSVAAFIVVGVTESGMAAMQDFTLPEAAAASVMPVPEPSRAMLLFAGIMAMAFTYRRAWLNWRRSAPQ
ncbi:PEP-CTERM sorting domain-containing protein [Prosthecobacter sp.]|uniref:PEP-CTERM sorting domain-containing protein n=1 Tax=Prosthecobacter sp. TaxID=1965333 RepID=UPI003783BE5D